MKTKTLLRWHQCAIGVAIAIAQAIPIIACNAGDRAADENLERSGRQDRGRAPGTYTVDRTSTPYPGSYSPTGGGSGKPIWTYTLNYTDVILSPDGRFLLGMAPLPGPDQGYATPGIALVVHELETDRRWAFPELVDLRRINFSPDGLTAWLLDKSGRNVRALRLDRLEVGAPIELEGEYSVLDVSPGGRFLIASNLPTTDLQETFFSGTCGSQPFSALSGCKIGVVDVRMKTSYDHALMYPLRDLDFSPVDGEVILTLATAWQGQTATTYIAFFRPALGDVVATLQVPNCSNELKLQKNGTLALLSPTTCQRDPISVIDVKSHMFLENLPGFGPVTISDDGKRAVGFTRQLDMAEQWGYSQKQKVGLIVVELPSLAWSVIEYGDFEPGYLLSPDGEWLYTYESDDYTVLDNWRVRRIETFARRIHLPDGETTTLSTPGFELSTFTMDPARKSLYALVAGQVYKLPFGSADPRLMAMGVAGSFENITMRPQGDYLVLGESNAPVFRVVPTWARRGTDTERIELELH